MAWPPTPSMRSRIQAFDDAVLAALEEAEKISGRSLASIEVGVEEVPPADGAAWEDSVVLGRAFGAEGSLRARIVLYRLPIQTRAACPGERDALVRHVVFAQLAALIGHPFDEDPA